MSQANTFICFISLTVLIIIVNGEWVNLGEDKIFIWVLLYTQETYIIITGHIQKKSDGGLEYEDYCNKGL